MSFFSHLSCLPGLDAGSSWCPRYFDLLLGKGVNHATRRTRLLWPRQLVEHHPSLEVFEHASHVLHQEALILFLLGMVWEKRCLLVDRATMIRGGVLRELG